MKLFTVHFSPITLCLIFKPFYMDRSYCGVELMHWKTSAYLDTYCNETRPVLFQTILFCKQMSTWNTPCNKRDRQICRTCVIAKSVLSLANEVSLLLYLCFGCAWYDFLFVLVHSRSTDKLKVRVLPFEHNAVPQEEHVRKTNYFVLDCSQYESMTLEAVTAVEMSKLVFGL